VLGLGLVEVAGEIVQLTLERRQPQPRVQALLGESPNGGELLAQQRVRLAQPGALGGDRGELVAPLRDLLGDAFDPAGVGLAAGLEQRPLLIDQGRPGGGELGIGQELTAVGLWR
jgi:hypothetical protein